MMRNPNVYAVVGEEVAHSQIGFSRGVSGGNADAGGNGARLNANRSNRDEIVTKQGVVTPITGSNSVCISCN